MSSGAPTGEHVGSGGAATIVFLHQGEQLLGGSQLQRVIEVGATSDPSGIYFEFRLPSTTYNRGEAQIAANQYAGAIEALLAQPYVVTAAYRQDVNPAGQLLDQIEAFWATPDGVAEGSTVIDLNRLLQGNTAPLIAADIATLTG